MITALLIGHDDRLTDLALPADPQDRVTAIQRHMACRIVSIVRLTTSLDLWLDDAPLRTGPANLAATALARRYGHHGRYLHGHVIITAAGPVTSLSRDQLLALAAHLADIAAARRTPR